MNIPHLLARLRNESDDALNRFSGDRLLFREAADALESALPAITSWNNVDALTTRIRMLTTNPYSPTDSQDAPMEPLT